MVEEECRNIYGSTGDGDGIVPEQAAAFIRALLATEA
jgi:hypothetical protein